MTGMQGLVPFEPLCLEYIYSSIFRCLLNVKVIHPKAYALSIFAFHWLKFIIIRSQNSPKSMYGSHSPFALCIHIHSIITFSSFRQNLATLIAPSITSSALCRGDDGQTQFWTMDVSDLAQMIPKQLLHMTILGSGNSAITAQGPGVMFGRSTWNLRICSFRISNKWKIGKKIRNVNG